MSKSTSRVALAFIVASVSAAFLSNPSARSALSPHGAFSPKVEAPRGEYEAAGDLRANKVTLTHAIERMPLYFIENRGQLDSRVAYYVQGRDTTLYFTLDGMTMALTDPKNRERASKGSLEKASLPRESAREPKSMSRWAVKLDFVGANPHPKIVAGDPTPAVVSYFKGPREKWKAGLATYGSIRLLRSLAGNRSGLFGNGQPSQVQLSGQARG